VKNDFISGESVTLRKMELLKRRNIINFLSVKLEGIVRKSLKTATLNTTTNTL